MIKDIWHGLYGSRSMYGWDSEGKGNNDGDRQEKGMTTLSFLYNRSIRESYASVNATCLDRN